MICRALKDLYYVEWFVLHWICITLNDLHYVKRFVLRWMIWTTLYDLYSIELFVQRWMICITLNLYDVEWFAKRWKICITLNDLECGGWFLQCWILDYNELLSIGFLMSSRCAYLRKHGKIFYTKLWFDFFLSWKCQEEIYSVLPQKLVIKSQFDHSSGNYC